MKHHTRQHILQSFWCHFVFALWTEWPAATLRSSSQRWTDLDGRPLFFGSSYDSIQRHTHPLSLQPVANMFSPQNHTEWPPRVAFLHTNAILSNLWKFITKHHTSSKTLDVHQNPPFPTFGPPLATRLLVFSSIKLFRGPLCSFSLNLLQVMLMSLRRHLGINFFSLMIGRCEQPFCAICQKEATPHRYKHSSLNTRLTVI